MSKRFGVKFSDLVMLSGTVKKVGPEDEARDKDGKWTATGDGFTDEEHDALRKYSSDKVKGGDSESYYKRINRGLITGKVDPDDEALVKRIDSAMDKSTLKSDMTLTRVATQRGDFNGDLFKNSIGKEITLPGYTSTSGAKVLGKDKIKGDMFFEIQAPKGSHGIDMTVKDEKGKGIYSRYTKENEVLLPRGSKFSIESVRQTPGKPYYDPQRGIQPGYDTHVKLKLLN